MPPTSCHKYIQIRKGKDMITYEEIVDFWEDKEPDCVDWFEQAAGLLQKKLGDALFRYNVKKIFGEEKLKDVVFPEKVHLITELFYGNIITTDIERVIETAFQELKHSKVPTLIPQVLVELANQNMDANTFCLIKLHGDVCESTSWVLTEEEYNLVYGENIENTSLFVSTLERLMISRKLLFLGCGLEQDRTYCTVLYKMWKGGRDGGNVPSSAGSGE